VGLPDSSKSATGKAARIVRYACKGTAISFRRTELALGSKLWEFWLRPLHEVVRAMEIHLADSGLR
jgi:hypothetical protein